MWPKTACELRGPFTLEVERRLRLQTTFCTHLLNKALIEILEACRAERLLCVREISLRLPHFEKLSREQITAVESRVNQLIRRNFPLVENAYVTMEEANEMGAIALSAKNTEKRCA